MKIAAKTIYGIQALFEIARHPSLEDLRSSEIARAQRIPLRFLEQILALLKKNKLVKSRRGKSGGYSLSRPAHDITLYEVLSALEGPLALGGEKKQVTALLITLKRIEDDFARNLKGVTLQDLVKLNEQLFAYSI
jgi:Rrf2 family protein